MTTATLTSNHYWFLYCLGLIVIVVFTASSVFLVVRSSVSHDTLRKHHDIAGYVIGTLGVLYSVFLGFTIVDTQDSYGTIIDRVNREAYLLDDLYHQANVLPYERKIQVQKSIREYVKTVIDKEWKLMAKKEESLKAIQKMDKIWSHFYSYRPKTETEKIWLGTTVNTLLKLNSARLERIYSSWNSLGPFIWISLIVGAIVIIILLFFFGTENARAHLLINGLFVGFLTFLLYVIYSLNSPFKPPYAVEPLAYEVIIAYYDENPTSEVSPEKSVKEKGPLLLE